MQTALALWPAAPAVASTSPTARPSRKGQCPPESRTLSVLISGTAQFGGALASTGNQLFVGAPMPRSGSSAPRPSPRAPRGVAVSAGTGDSFGYSVAARDSYVVVGIPKDDVSVSDTGFVQLFTIKAGSLTPVKRIAQSPTGVPRTDEKGRLRTTARRAGLD